MKIAAISVIAGATLISCVENTPNSTTCGAENFQHVVGENPTVALLIVEEKIPDEAIIVAGNQEDLSELPSDKFIIQLNRPAVNSVEEITGIVEKVYCSK